MAAKVSIASSTAARTASTHAGEPSGPREPSGAPNRFSSLMDAASQPEASSDQKPSGPARSTSDTAATARVAGQGQSRGQGQGQGPKSTTANEAAAAAGAPGTMSMTSSTSAIDGDTEDQDSGSLDRKKMLSKLLTAPGATPADASALTLLLSSTGNPVDGSNTSDTKSSNDGASKSADDDASQYNAAAAGALAVGMIMGSAGAAGPMPNLKAGDIAQSGDAGAIGSATTGSATTGSATAGSATAVSVQSASQSTDQSLIEFDALNAGTTPNDASLASDLSTLKSPDGDSQSSQLTALAGSAGSAAIARNSNIATAPSTGIERTINLPVGDRNWSGAVAGHVQWMVSSNIQSATLQLSPEHLGPVEVRIDVHQSQVNVSFSADHPETRSALEQSVPALRAIFAGGGLTLGQTSVQQESRSASQFSQPSARPSLMAPGTADSVALSSIRALGLVDEYA